MHFVPEAIETYCEQHSSLPSEVCAQIEEFTHDQVPQSVMLTGPLVGSFLGLLVETLQARQVLEIGTFTGYSALCMAERLPAEGVLTTCDINPQTQEIAKRFWAKSPHGKKIIPKLAPALDTMASLEPNFDLLFIDADKGNYLNYLKRGLELLKPTGLVVVDNCLWSGRVLDKNPEKDTQAIKEFNDWVVANPKLHCTLVPIRDGMLLIRKV